MQTKIVWKEGVHFSATPGSGHTIEIDGPADYGGQDAGARPMELMLMGMGACSSFDVVTILKKARQKVTGCVAEVHAERASEPPKVFTYITLHFVVTGTDLSAKKVERALHLSATQYCSASIMLQRAGVEIAHTFEIVEDTVSDEEETHEYRR